MKASRNTYIVIAIFVVLAGTALANNLDPGLYTIGGNTITNLQTGQTVTYEKFTAVDQIIYNESNSSNRGKLIENSEIIGATTNLMFVESLEGSATISVEKYDTVISIGRCLKYSKEKERCMEWINTNIPFSENNGIITFDVTIPGIYAGIDQNQRFKTKVFTGSTTDLKSVNKKSINGLTIERPKFGKVEYRQSVDLSEAEDIEELEDTVIIKKNSVKINTDNIPNLNRPATITLYGVNYQYEPIILQDGQVCVSCTVTSYANGQVVFNVPHFTNYSSTSNSQLRVFDEADNLPNGNVKYAYDMIIFSANFSDLITGVPLNGGGEFCDIHLKGQTQSMTFNATTDNYEYRTFFDTLGEKQWNVSCDGSGSGYENINISDRVEIHNRSDRWYDVFVDRGSINTTTTNTSTVINYSDPKNSFVVYTDRTIDSTPDDRQFTFKLVNATNLSFDRFHGPGISAVISYEVISSKGIRAQSGTISQASGTNSNSQTIAPVNPDTSFGIAYGRCADENSSDNFAGLFTINITNATNINVTRGNGNGCAAAVSWQVVDWASIKLQKGTSSIQDNSDSITDTINAVNLTNSFLVLGSAAIGTDFGMDSNLIQGTIPSDNLVSFTDEPGTTYGSSRDLIDWYVIELPNASVETGTIGLNADTNQAVGPVVMNRTFHVSSGWNTGGGQTYANSDYESALTTNINVLFDKQTAGQTQNLAYFVVEMVEGDGVPTFYNLTNDPANNSVYNLSDRYEFNVTILDTNTDVGFSFGGVNYTPDRNGDDYNVTIRIGAGNHTYFWWAHGTGEFEPYNKTQDHTFTIQKQNSSVQAHVNNTRNNITIERRESIYLNGTLLLGELDIQLYLNHSQINTGPGPLANMTQFNVNGTFNVSVIHEESENYTYGIETWFVTVNDTIPPNMTNFMNASITDVAVLIQWNTDEPANSSIRWGNTTAKLNQTIDTAFLTFRSILINNLTPNTTYYWNATSCDPYGNCNTSVEFNFTTLTEPDNRSPQINNVSVIAITENTANITWINDENANGSIDWGPNTSLINNTIDAVYKTNHNVMISGLLPLTLYYFNITSCDPSGNCNVSGLHNFTTIDSTAPTWSLNRTDPLSGVTYVPGASYQFNITWNDNVEVGNVVMEHNFTGTFVNYSVGNISNEYHYNYTDLAAGLYTWRMWANDTSNNTAASDQFNYTITRITADVNLTLNGSYQNLTINKRQSVNITAWNVLPSTGNISILRNGGEIFKGNNNITTLSTFFLSGIYNITARFPGTQNYSEAIETLFVTVLTDPPDQPTNVQAETGFYNMTTGNTQAFVDLINTYNLSKTFMKIHHASSNGGNAVPNESTTSVHFFNESRIVINRYADAGNGAYTSYSILQADNIEVVNFTKKWGVGEETDELQLASTITSNYENRCFIETHRNMRLNSSDNPDFTEHEIRAFIVNESHINLTRDTEGGNVASIGTQYGYVVCFLDETSVQSGIFSISGGAGANSPRGISAVNTSESFNIINYMQADDGVGQNAIKANFTSGSQLTIYRDEQGGSQSAFGRYFVVDFEDKSNGMVQDIYHLAPGTGTLLDYETSTFNAIDQNKTFLACENTMAAGGGAAHTRSQWAFEFGSSDDTVVMYEGRDRGDTQYSTVNCQVITWPNLTSYQIPPDLVVLNISVPNETYVGVNTTVSVNISNLLENEAENVTIRLNVSDWKGTGWVFNETLSAMRDFINGTYSEIVTFSWNASKGDKNFTAFIDSDEQVDEFNETNNILSLNITVDALIISDIAAYLNGTRGNATIIRNNSVYLNATLIEGVGDIELYLNGSLINQGPSPLSNLTFFLDEGIWNVTAHYPGNSNYTNNTEMWWLTVVNGSPPTISGVNSVPSDASALITWSTDKYSNSTVHYGTTASLGSSTGDPAEVLSHSVNVVSLAPITTYFFLVESCSIFGCTNSTLNSFSTLAPQGRCVPNYVERGPNFQNGYISKGDVVKYECQLPAAIGENEELGVVVNWNDVGTRRTVNTPRLLHGTKEALYP